MNRTLSLFALLLNLALLVSCGGPNVSGGSGTEAESTFAGIVVDSLNNPIANAQLYIKKTDYILHPDSAPPNPDGVSDEKGLFKIKVQDTGSYRIEIQKQDPDANLSATLESSTPASESYIELDTIKMWPSESISGNIALPSSAQVVYVGIVGTIRLVEVDLSGNFSLVNLAPGNHNIQVVNSEGLLSPPVLAQTNTTPAIINIDLNMRYIKNGCFNMGSPSTDPDATLDEFPQHEVCLDAFYLERKEVTIAEYQACIDSGICSGPQTGGDCDTVLSLSGDHPIACVDWNQADTYCQWKGQRLPTEAEWEYASRSGTTSPYYGDETGEELCSYARVNDSECPSDSPLPVMSLAPNRWGLYDVFGNMSEWTQDWHDTTYYSISPRNNPQGPLTGLKKAARGGRWNNLKIDSRSANRYDYQPNLAYNWIGFRCADTP